MSDPGDVLEDGEQVFAAGAAELNPHDGGYWPARRSAIVTKLANDHVKSYVERGIPVVLLNCSESDPFEGG